MRLTESRTVKLVSLLFSFAFLAAVPFAVLYSGSEDVFGSWITLLTSPCPLITDYFMLGSLPAAFFNAGICGLVCALLLLISDGDYTCFEWAGFFLVVAHCFYGLNLLSMLFPMLGFLLYCLIFKKPFKNNLGMAMMSTAFGPFFSELLWRYPFENKFVALFVCLLLAVFLGFTIPAMLEGAKALHKGFDLYNAGLAFGLLGLFVFSFLFNTIGVPKPEAVSFPISSNYFLFCNVFFSVVFAICILLGFIADRNVVKSYRLLMNESGRNCDFIASFGGGEALFNLGVYGFSIMLYLDFAILLTDGIGWTGPTCGVTLAAITFAASGQHPKNVWPIMGGYVSLFVLVKLICTVLRIPMVWSLSTQAYINGLAFATGLCPFTGEYGIFAGFLAGFTDAVICTTTSTAHGGFMLYNGGFTAGLTALILNPVLGFYSKKKH